MQLTCEYLFSWGPCQSDQEPSLVSAPPLLLRWEQESKGHILYVYSLSLYSKHCPDNTENTLSEPTIIKDLEKSLKSEWLPRTYEKTSHTTWTLNLL